MRKTSFSANDRLAKLIRATKKGNDTKQEKKNEWRHPKNFFIITELNYTLKKRNEFPFIRWHR